MTAITWTLFSPGCKQSKAQRVSGGKLHIVFFCAMVPCWFNMHRHTEVGNKLYASLDTFLSGLPRHYGSSMIFFFKLLCLPQRDKTYSMRPTTTQRLWGCRAVSTLEFSWVWFPDEICFWSSLNFLEACGDALPSKKSCFYQISVLVKSYCESEKGWVWGHDFSLKILLKR